MIILRPAQAEDEPSIGDFLRGFYGARSVTKYPERWRWQFVNNPFAPARALPILLALDDRRVVGQLGLQYVPLWLDGRTTPAAWGVDFGVAPAYRGRGIGQGLQALAAQSVSYLLSARMDEAAARIKRRLGFVPGRRIRAWRRFFRLSARDVVAFLDSRSGRRGPWLRKGIERLGRSGWGAAVGAGAIRLGSRAYELMTLPGRPAATSGIEEIHSFGSDLDALWERSRGGYEMATARDSALLNWRYVQCPGLRYRMFRAVRGGEETAGYIVVRERQHPEPRSVRIVDLFSARGNRMVLHDLVQHVVKLWSPAAPFLEAATSDAVQAKVLRAAGFVPMEVETPYVGGSGGGSEAVRRGAKEWFVTMGDHDWDQARPLREETTAGALEPAGASPAAKGAA